MTAPTIEALRPVPYVADGVAYPGLWRCPVCSMMWSEQYGPGDVCPNEKRGDSASHLRAERDAARAEAAELDRRLADAEDERSALKGALCLEEERRYAAMRRARVWKAAAKRWRAEVERLRAALKWYADEGRYDFSKYFSHSEAEADNGDRAREALRGGAGQGGGA